VPLKVRNVGLNPGRLGFVAALRRMGAKITLAPRRRSPEPAGDLTVRPAPLKAAKFPPLAVPSMIDELPLLAVVAAAARGTTVIAGAGELRHKESDRVAATLALLKKLGAEASYSGGTLRVKGPARLKPAAVSAAGDHRIAMAAAAAAVAAGEVKIAGAGCVAKSYPAFFRDFAAVFG